MKGRTCALLEASGKSQGQDLRPVDEESGTEEFVLSSKTQLPTVARPMQMKLPMKSLLLRVVVHLLAVLVVPTLCSAPSGAIGNAPSGAIGNASSVGVRDLSRIIEPFRRKKGQCDSSQKTTKCPMFSVAVSVRKKDNRYDVDQVSQDAPEMFTTIQQGKVYQSSSKVAATVLQKPDGVKHAERRVLENLKSLLSDDSKSSLLVFFVFASPCLYRCMSDDPSHSILPYLHYLKEWNDYAFVFSRNYIPRGSSGVNEKDALEVLERLGNRIDKKKIFRCDYINDLLCCVPCYSTSDGYNPWCYTDKQPVKNNVNNNSKNVGRSQGVGPHQSGSRAYSKLKRRR